MTFEDVFLDLMPLTMSVTEFVAFNNYGEPTYSTSPTTYRCRVEYEPVKMNTPQGEEVVMQATAYVAAQTALSPMSHYVLPDGTTGNLQSISIEYDETGVHHNVIRFGA